jgi:MFS family permease
MLGWFKWVYAAFSPLGGWLADRFSRRWTLGASLVAWSAVTVATGQVTTFEGLLWTRALMGISEAFYIPAALALITDYHLGCTRSKAVGMHQIGIYLGVIVGGFSGYVADAPGLGWRWAFGAVGLVGILYAVPLMTLLKDAPRATVPDGTKTGFLSGARELALNPSYLLLVAYFTLPAMAAWVVRDWGPSILQKSFQMGQGPAGVLSTSVVQVAAIFAALSAGALADAWSRRTLRGRIFTSGLGMIIIIPGMCAIGAATQWQSFALVVVGLVLFGVGWGFFDVNNMPILSQIVPARLRATGYGLMNMVSIFFGGLIDKFFGRWQDSGVSVYFIFSVFSGIALFSLALVLLIRPKAELSEKVAESAR